MEVVCNAIEMGCVSVPPLMSLAAPHTTTSSLESWKGITAAKQNPHCYWQSDMEDDTEDNSPQGLGELSALQLYSVTVWRVR